MGLNVEYDIEELLKNIDVDKIMMKRRSNGLLLSDEHLEILKKYNFNHLNYNNLGSLIYDIEVYLNENQDASDLEWLSSTLAELNYYQNTNK